MAETQITYIDSALKLQSAVLEIQAHSYISLDLEFDRNRHRYGFNLCLMQLMAGDTCYLIDPLIEGIDLQPIYHVLENPDVLVIVFSFQEDLMLLHSLGCRPNNIFDTGLAIRLLDKPQSSLALVLHEYLQIEVNKDAQMSNWYTRPLSSEQYNYAAQDVLHLPSLMRSVENEAKDRKVLSWIGEENMHFESIDYSVLGKDNPLKEKYKRDFNEVQWYIFSRIIEYREELARDKNLPRGRVMRDDYIKDIILNNGLRYWDKNRSTHQSVRKETVKSEIREILSSTEKEALQNGLSHERTARKRLSREAFLEIKDAKRKKEFYLDEVAKPIQKELRSNLGENMAIFILSNRMAADLYENQDLSIPSYRKTLIKQAGDSVDFEDKAKEIYNRTLYLL